MDLETLGKWLVVFAGVLALVGGLLWVGGRLGLGGWLGNLPGDLRFSGEGWGCFVPITTSIVLSILLTLVLNLLFRWFR